MRYAIGKKIVSVTPKAAKDEGGGLPKYLWDSSLEETNEKGEAVNSDNGSTAQCTR